MSDKFPDDLVAAVKEFWEHVPHCCGYPACDGDLVGIAHSEKCPLFKRQREFTTMEFAVLFHQHMVERGGGR